MKAIRLLSVPLIVLYSSSSLEIILSIWIDLSGLLISLLLLGALTSPPLAVAVAITLALAIAIALAIALALAVGMAASSQVLRRPLR
jgi:hypothetical protein